MGPTRYRFFVAGRIEPADEAAFDGLTVEYDHDTTTLSGVVSDPQALMTILVRIIELDLILLGLRANGHFDEPAG